MKAMYLKNVQTNYSITVVCNVWRLFHQFFSKSFLKCPRRRVNAHKLLQLDNGNEEHNKPASL
jgi:hypothetical protein